MADRDYGVEMSETEIAAFLAEKGDGVLSFGGTASYAIPISFGYDVPNRRIVFQFVFGPDSEKRSHVEADDPVTLVAYEWNSVDDWQSVVVTGHLSPIEIDSEAEVDAAAVFAEFATPIDMSVLGHDADDLDPEWYEFTFEELHGRASPMRDD